MHQDPSNLVNAVSAALGESIRASKHADRRFVQKGAYILNIWGYGPRYRFDRDVRGPYSTDLEEDLFDLIITAPSDTMDVSAEDVERLSGILKRGIRFTEAYTIILRCFREKPWMPPEEIIRETYDVGEYIHVEVEDAFRAVVTDMSGRK